MSIFSRNNYWKIILMVLGVGILVLTVLYSNFLASRLKSNEEKNILLYTEAIKRLFQPNPEEEGSSLCEENYIGFLELVRDSFPLPVIYEDDAGNLEGYNFSERN
ncbi:MAG: hypothetical protein IPN89_13555 [Saprospiraceae bacterium]|nr:hypothetical protein [Saprospiraceae bacterium]